ncbi:helix-turn-helix domain-containing protein [Pseudomonas sp. S9]|uniref:helix-turn-helix domain-containing protein n=1 Tax=Pseudomonas sp. S9 TaxID=686578 RepID=UPI00030BD105|nr:helix-turn-helix domain-containing protein [Pseudomonas sp. S9]
MKLVTITALAELCNVPSYVAHQWVQSGQIPSLKVGKTRYIDIDKLTQRPSDKE